MISKDVKMLAMFLMPLHGFDFAPILSLVEHENYSLPEDSLFNYELIKKSLLEKEAILKKEDKEFCYNKVIQVLIRNVCNKYMEPNRNDSFVRYQMPHGKSTQASNTHEEKLTQT